jgi:ABC-type multidrug transport system fused ATPase/permease subunit
MRPAILARSRRRAFFGLVGLTAGEAVSLAGAAAAAQSAVAAVTAELSVSAPLTWLLATSCAVAAFGWARAVAAEDFGMRYANEMRRALAAQTIAASAAGSRRRLGAVTARMAGDLLALKQWASLGVSDAAAAAASLIAGATALTVANGVFGVSVAAALVLCNAVLLGPLAFALKHAWAVVRRERGRVAGFVGDITLASAAIARFAADRRELRRLDHRSERLRRASVRQRGLAAMALAPSALTAAIAIFAAASAPALGLDGPHGIGEWAGYMFGVGLLASAFSGLARALDAWLAFRVADERLNRLDEASDIASEHDPLSDAVAAQASQLDLQPGAIHLMSAPDAGSALALVSRLARKESGVSLQGHAASSMSDGAHRRACAIASPETPLLRASARRNLSLTRRSATDAELLSALELAGVASLSLTTLLDPEAGEPDSWTQMRLRLARAIASRPRAIFIAEPLLVFDPQTPRLVSQIVAETGVAIVCAYQDDVARA